MLKHLHLEDSVGMQESKHKSLFVSLSSVQLKYTCNKWALTAVSSPFQCVDLVSLSKLVSWIFFFLVLIRDPRVWKGFSEITGQKGGAIGSASPALGESLLFG